MATPYTFQKLWKIQVGQFLEGGFTPIYELTEERFKASIRAEVKSAKSGETPQTSKIQLYNIGYERVASLSDAENTHIQIDAGYLIEEGKYNTVDTLPTIYIGKIVHSYTYQLGQDVVTELTCIPNYTESAKGVANKVFNEGVSVKDVFTYLASTMSLPLELKSKKLEKPKLIIKTTVEGTSAKKMSEWCDKYDLRWVTDKNRILVVDKEVEITTIADHQIPLRLVKGQVQTSVDLKKALKEKTKPVINYNFTTFLFAKIDLADVVEVDLVDYTVYSEVGNKNVYTQSLVVEAYQHVMDSHEGTKWDTIITGKGG